METFATAINCMDGRVQIPVIEHIKRNYGVDFVDMITLPGPNGILAGSGEEGAVESIRRCVQISVDRHGSRLIAVCGHHDCAGNPNSRETQLEQIRDAMELVGSWHEGVRVIGLWINQDWEVEEAMGSSLDI